MTQAESQSSSRREWLRSEEAERREKGGYKVWLPEFFPGHFYADFGEPQEEFWAWGWDIERGVRPAPFGAWWARGMAKSTNGEAWCVMLGARRLRDYGLYISRTQDQANDHVGNIAAMLESDEIAEHYPTLSERMVNKFGASKGWKIDRLRTASGLTVDGIGLNELGGRGAKIDWARPGFLVFDDIDLETDSLEMVRKIIKVISKKLIPAATSV